MVLFSGRCDTEQHTSGFLENLIRNLGQQCLPLKQTTAVVTVARETERLPPTYEPSVKDILRFRACLSQPHMIIVYLSYQILVLHARRDNMKAFETKHRQSGPALHEDPYCPLAPTSHGDHHNKLHGTLSIHKFEQGFFRAMGFGRRRPTSASDPMTPRRLPRRASSEVPARYLSLH